MDDFYDDAEFNTAPVNLKELISHTSPEGYRERVSAVLIHIMDKLYIIQANGSRIEDRLGKTFPEPNPFDIEIKKRA
ncbi:hypothetical protein [Leptospira levettii]|uniref:hypothetical protein n=1 Tax=Leptospira levettii TaxID=2023178 RepID=UPI00223DE7C8|nr:hypothetical protein [Leptospira levettii]MCW7467798.1 hypothetical protein [Leptospira levettii]MCW7472615.1 hypothetical protein [Leptospira levettii]